MKENNKIRVYMYIKNYISEHGYPPSTREIAAGVNIKSTSSVHYILKELIEEGRIETDAEPGAPRAIRLVGYRLTKI